MTQLTGSKVHADKQYRYYHKDVFIPDNIKTNELLIKQVLSRRLSYSRHATQQAELKGLPLPIESDIIKGTIFEYKTDIGNIVREVGVRAEFAEFDLCFIISTDGTVITVYGRRKGDIAVRDTDRYIKR